MAKVSTEFPPGPASKFSPKLLCQLATDPIKTLGEFNQRYGEIVHFKIGRDHIYLINNPNHIEKILIYNHKNFKKGKRLQNCKEIVR